LLEREYKRGGLPRREPERRTGARDLLEHRSALIPPRRGNVLELPGRRAAAQAGKQATGVVSEFGLGNLAAAQRAGFLLGFHPIAEQSRLVLCQQSGNDRRVVFCHASSLSCASEC